MIIWVAIGCYTLWMGRKQVRLSREIKQLMELASVNGTDSRKKKNKYTNDNPFNEHTSHIPFLTTPYARGYRLFLTLPERGVSWAEYSQEPLLQNIEQKTKRFLASGTDHHEHHLEPLYRF